jgi:hypothetical protein
LKIEFIENERRNVIKLHGQKRIRRSRVISIAMLCLFAHALFVSVTHHHSSRSNSSAPSASVTAENGGESDSSPGSTSDAHCLSCRLQRNFTSNVHSASIVVQPFDEPLTIEAPNIAAAVTGSARLLFGRAPPLT